MKGKVQICDLEVTLCRDSMKVDNIFNLVHHFGDEEDQVSACFAFILRINDGVLMDFLRDLGLRIDDQELKHIEIETQVHYRNIGIVDIQISLKDKFMVFVESKIWGNRPTRQQLVKYANFLNMLKPRFVNHIRLVLTTQVERGEEFSKMSKRIPLLRREKQYLRWKDLQEKVEKTLERGKHVYVNRMFLEYLGDKMKDEKVIEEQRIGDIEEIVVVSTTPEWWEINRTRLFYTQSMRYKPRDAQYVAFYRTKPIRAITHIAKVVRTKLNVPAEKMYKGTPMAKEAKTWGLEKVFIIRKPVKLPRPITHGKRLKQIRSLKYTTFEKLLTAETLDDL